MDKLKNLEALTTGFLGKMFGKNEIPIIPEMTSEQLLALESGKRPAYTEMGYLGLNDNVGGRFGYGGTANLISSARNLEIPLNEKRIKAVMELEGDGAYVAMIGRGRVNDLNEKVYFYFQNGEGDLFSFAPERILSYTKS